MFSVRKGWAVHIKNRQNLNKFLPSIYLNINQLDALNFIMSLFHVSTCFEHHVLIVRRSKFYYTASVTITLFRWPSRAHELGACAPDGHL